MRKFIGILVVVLVSVFSFETYAQDPAKIGKIVNREMQKRTQVMKLDATQQPKVKDLLTTFYTDRMNAKKLEGKEKGQKMREIGKTLDEGLAAVCTPEQLESWNKHIEEEKAAKK